MIELARCDDFVLGPVTVRPSSRELLATSGSVMIEPKVMQVLVALAHADGRVVSRDDLIAKCWSGRVVGDDAINRVIGKLRRVADSVAPHGFRIETVARTGYRLVEPAAAASHTSAEPAVVMPDTPRRAKPALWPWAVAVAAVAALMLAVVPRPWREARPLTPAAMPAAVTDLETRGLSAMFDNTPEQTVKAIAYLRKATALAPRSAPVWGSLAMSYVLSLGWTSPAERAAVAARVREAAAHGLALNPRESRSAAALVSLEPTFGRWSAKASALKGATQRAQPDSGPLAYQRVQFMMAVGRCHAALAEIELIAKFSPLVPWIQATHTDLLAAVGRLEEADRAAEEARNIWPRDRLIWFTRFDLAAFNGQPERALAMTADHASWPKQTTPKEIELAARTARAIMSHDPGEIDDVLKALGTGKGAGDAERLVRVATVLGRPDIALAAARRLFSGRLSAQPRATMLPLIGFPADDDPPTAALFLPPASSLWSTPGFATLMSDIGLTDYWRRSGPADLCKARGQSRGYDRVGGSKQGHIADQTNVGFQ